VDRPSFVIWTPARPGIFSLPSAGEIPVDPGVHEETVMADYNLPDDWQAALGPELEKPYFERLKEFVAEERKTQEIFPPPEDVFQAFELCPYDNVSVVLLGQDPYHDNGQAHGLCFSVKPGIKVPPSLVNMYKELEADLGHPRPNHGYLVDWARQGMLMITAVLTVRAHKANSHKSKGWEKFTDAVIRQLSADPRPIVFVLWGGYAKKKIKLIDTELNAVIQGTHPSPLSARNGFFGSRPYTAINEKLEEFGHPTIDWRLDNI